MSGGHFCDAAVLARRQEPFFTVEIVMDLILIARLNIFCPPELYTDVAEPCWPIVSAIVWA